MSHLYKYSVIDTYTFKTTYEYQKSMKDGELYITIKRVISHSEHPSKYIGTLEVPSFIDGAPVRVLGKRCFMDYLGYKVVLPVTLRQIKDEAFMNSSIHSIIFNYGLRKIGYGAFVGCSELKELILPKTVTKIEESFCSGCNKLKTVKLSKIKKIPCLGFSGCSNLKSIFIPKRVKRIETAAFLQSNRKVLIIYEETRRNWNDVKLSTDFYECIDGNIIYCNKQF